MNARSITSAAKSSSLVSEISRLMQARKWTQRTKHAQSLFIPTLTSVQPPKSAFWQHIRAENIPNLPTTAKGFSPTFQE
jgi:hypothetical protein